MTYLDYTDVERYLNITLEENGVEYVNSLISAVTVKAASHQDSFYDTAGNQRAYSFLLRYHYPLSSGRDQAAENRLLPNR